MCPVAVLRLDLGVHCTLVCFLTQLVYHGLRYILFACLRIGRGRLYRHVPIRTISFVRHQGAILVSSHFLLISLSALSHIIPIVVLPMSQYNEL